MWDFRFESNKQVQCWLSNHTQLDNKNKREIMIDVAVPGDSNIRVRPGNTRR